jgi:hypothetical protein
LAAIGVAAASSSVPGVPTTSCCGCSQLTFDSYKKKTKWVQNASTSAAPTWFTWVLLLTLLSTAAISSDDDAHLAPYRINLGAATRGYIRLHPAICDQLFVLKKSVRKLKNVQECWRMYKKKCAT